MRGAKRVRGRGPATQALTEFRYVARSGARFVLSVPHSPEWFPNQGRVLEGYPVAEITRLIKAAGWRVLRAEYCMLIPLIALENLIPMRCRLMFLPYDIVVAAETAG